ncbi:hypothetical protein CONPUDRAFT_168247 [Coniophora puteana RWD-64-598 SS2]|uniref:Uncharacterized protein n=1 Tax=Coniophora puteana (strain RWD-64-598) TaxID=741705 RepID=A0A5M3MDE1_CONPW|nr:uncharacterized protein CONPUDRAFT_168247 [Coniophora puteana RWD-64-598 SS2]EIW77272.1 hypothetical protein CONPUDRAFT_168247 [Coniophora puteana RWD-64-598 SS2]
MNTVPAHTPPQYTRSSPKTSPARNSSNGSSSSTTASAELALQRQYMREHWQSGSGGVHDGGPISLQPVDAMYSRPATSGNLPDAMNSSPGAYPAFGDIGQEREGYYQPSYPPNAPLPPTTPIRVGNQRLPYDPYGSHHTQQPHQQTHQYPPTASSSRLPLAVNPTPNMTNIPHQSQSPVGSSSSLVPFHERFMTYDQQRFDPLYKVSNHRNAPNAAVVAPSPPAVFVPGAGVSAGAGASTSHSHTGWPAPVAAPQGAYPHHPQQQQQQQVPMGYAQSSSAYPQGHHGQQQQQYGQGYSQWQGQGLGHVRSGSSSSSNQSAASPQSFVSHSLSPVSPGPSAYHGFPSTQNQNQNQNRNRGHSRATQFKEVPQRDYEKRGGIFKEAPQPSIVFREVGAGAGVAGVRLAKLENLAEPDEEVTGGMKTNQTMRVNWPGYDKWESQLPGRDDRSPKRPLSRRKLARKIAHKMSELIKAHENQRCSEQYLRWKVGGHDGLRLEDLYLVELQHISQGSWRPVIHVRADRVA